MFSGGSEAASTVHNSKVCLADMNTAANGQQITLAGSGSAQAEARTTKCALVSAETCPESGTLPTASVSSSRTDSANARYQSIKLSASAQCDIQQGARSSSESRGWWVLQVQKRHAKTVKDALKALGFLNRHGRVIQADRSAAEVALPLTASGAAHIQAISRSLSNSTLDCDNGSCNRASGEARRATKEACRDVACDAQTRQLDSPIVPALLCSSDAAHTAPTQSQRAVLTDILGRGLGRVAEQKVVARTGLTAPADALRAAVERLLFSKGDSQDPLTLTLTQLYPYIALHSQLLIISVPRHARCCATWEQSIMRPSLGWYVWLQGGCGC